MNAKQHWKRYYRLLRVARREALKSAIDMMCYGTGAVFIPNNGSDPRHIPTENIFVREFHNE